MNSLLARRLRAPFSNNVTTTVLVVDDDLGFVFWLGRTLAEIGYEVWPARSVPGALKLIGEFRPSVDLLIVNASLGGTARLIADLRHLQDDLKIISVVEELDHPSRWSTDAQWRKPDHVDYKARLGWLQVIESVLWNENLSLSAHN
jgi:response regulator RpfG family c-di-GMP phosphodiesterase